MRIEQGDAPRLANMGLLEQIDRAVANTRGSAQVVVTIPPATAAEEDEPRVLVDPARILTVSRRRRRPCVGADDERAAR